MGLFESTRYFLASSIPPHRQEQLEYALSKNGATKADSILNATHVISDSPWFEGADVLENLKEERKASGEGEEDVDSNVPAVVSDYWVDRTLVLGKIQPPQYYSVDPAMLFSGIVACAAELQAHDLEVLSAGISALGGQWRVALTNDVTHLFCISPSSTKYAAALAHREGTGIKIVLPHWFDDSVRLGIRGLPVEPYEWPDPPFLRDIGVNVKKLGHAGQDGEEEKAKCEGGEDKLKEKAKKNMMVTANQFTPSATNSRTPLPKDVDLIPVKRGVFDNKRILLSWTLSLYSSRREAVEAGIRRAGGVVLRYPGDDDDDLSTEEKERRRDKKEARAVSECDLLITRWRSGKAYGKAFKLCKTIGTMAWLYHVQSSGLMPRPVDQLLHYPIPRRPIQSFLQHEITVTNYTGEAREYIKRIITAMGAKFTPMMTGKNTVLIAAYIHGQKTDKARAWSLPIVNHTWLEDCFIQWRHLTTSTDKYIMFPPGMDFSRLLGERGVGVRGVELCDEDEMKEDEGSSDEEVYEEQDKVLKMGIEEDIDMISMPDTDDPGTDIVFEDAKVNNTISSKSRSPAKQSVVAASTSPTKRSVNDTATSSAVRVSPVKSKSKSVSPAKRRRIVSDDDDEEMALNQPEQSEDEESRHRKTKSTTRTPRKSSAMDMSSEEKVTPARKSKQRPTSVSRATPSKRHPPMDLELTDDSDSEIDGTPELIAKIRAKTNGAGEDGSPKKKRRIDKGKEKSPTKLRIVSSEDEEEENNVDGDNDDNTEESLLESRPKKKLVRRLTNEASLQLAELREKEEAEAEASGLTSKPKRLIRRVNSKLPQSPVPQEPTETDAEHDKENVAESVSSTSKTKSPSKDQAKKKSDAPNAGGGLLKTKRGDARTRVKAKSATAKARELYSDSEGEVEGIIASKTQDSLPGKGGKGRKKQTKEAKSKKVSWPSEEEEPKVVESESDGEEEIKKASNNSNTPVKRTVSVVVELPPSAKKVQMKNTYAGSSKAKRKVQEASDEEGESQEEEEEEDELPTRTRSRQDSVKKADSIHVEAGEAPSTSRPKPKSKPKPKPVPTKHSSLSATNTLDTRTYTTTSSNDSNEIVEQHPTRRGAATKAEAKLKEMMPDATKYEQEAKKARKSGGWTNMWEKELEKEKEREKVVMRKKRNSDAVEDAEEEGPSKKRRRSSGVGGKVKDEEVEGSGSGMEVEVKKGRTSGSMPKEKVYLLTTQVTLASEVVRALEKLGVVMSTKVSQCTHLIAPSLVRTEKFLCALAAAPIILQESWAVKSAQAKELLRAWHALLHLADFVDGSSSIDLAVDEFLLRDTAAETRYQMKLSDALARAKEYKGKLCENKMFYVTTKTKVAYKLLKSVVTAHGGQLSQQTPTVRLLTGQADRHVVSCPEDISIWRSLAAQGIPIYTHEFLLLGVLKQKLEWDLEEFRVPGSF